MTGSVPFSILYFISCIIILSGFYLLKKSEKVLNGVTWLAITFITFMCYNASVAAIINLVSIKVNIVSFSVINILLGCYMLYRVIKQKQKQSYEYKKFDIFAMVAIIAVVVVIALKRYGITLQLNYDTSDPSVHMQYAMNVVNNQRVADMLFAPLNNALFIELLSPLFVPLKYYKIFIIADILMLMLSGMIFYALIEKFMEDNFLKCAGLLTAILYMIGYPLNNMLWGFVYLGMGVSVIAYMIFSVDNYIKDELNKVINIIMIAMASCSIFLCYALFMPVVYLGTFICLSLYFFKKKELFTFKTIGRYILIYLIPIILGFIYMYFGVFSDGVTPESAIANEGIIYRDLYTSLVFMLPLAIYGVCKVIKRRENNSTIFILPALIIFMLGLLIVGLNTGKVSSYYYYKNYYLLWFLLMYMFFYGVHILSKVDKTIIVAGFSVFAAFGLMIYFNVEGIIYAKNAIFWAEPKAQVYAGVYGYNYGQFSKPRRFVGMERHDLYKFVVDNYVSKGDYVPALGEGEEIYWYESITNQREPELYEWKVGEKECLDIIKNDSNISYVTVFYSSTTYADNVGYFESLEKVYGNSVGFVCKVK